MTDRIVEQKPSETALFTALRRTLANKEFRNEKFGPDYLAVYFLPPFWRFILKFETVRASTKNKLAGAFPGANEYLIARTAYFDQLFVEALNAQIPQIVLLGAGYDSRAYRFAKLNQGTQIFELDIAPTQNRKKKCLKEAQIDIPQQVKLVAIDFNKESLRDTLEKAGYKPGEKTLFAWEGVSYYLDVKSVDAVLEFLSHSARDSLIAFDYSISITEENMNRYDGAKEFAQSMKEHHAQEGFLFALDEGEIEAFLEQRGLKMIEHLDKEAIERAYLLDDDGSSLGQIAGHFRLVLASPKNE